LSTRLLFALVAALSMTAGIALWVANRPPQGPGPGPAAGAPSISPSALYAASFADAAGQRQALGQFAGKVLVVNFWATWCAPCREEMPAFVRIQDRWASKGVQFVGLSAESPEKAAAFGRALGINYPLWTGGEDVGELSRRLGNTAGVLPHSALIGPDGRVLETKVGPYSELELEGRLEVFVAKTR
jgi:thiol-disulfide isomerase/thioredoxin